MSRFRKQLSALAILACFAVAVVYVEGGRPARWHGPRVGKRAPQKSPAPGVAFKRAVYLEDDGALAEAGRAPWRYLSSGERRAGSVGAKYRPEFLLRLILAPKVSTNLFSVLNL